MTSNMEAQNIAVQDESSPGFCGLTENSDHFRSAVWPCHGRGSSDSFLDFEVPFSAMFGLIVASSQPSLNSSTGFEHKKT